MAGDFAQAVYWIEERDTGAPEDEITSEIIVHLRMFAPLDGIPEDPATGSAAATLATLMFETAEGSISLRIHQGDDMGRPSVIWAKADAYGVTIAGTAIQVMRGQLSLS
jgi:trans-2,3-dihydro-3-hydroxyanthranilate isomerase